MSELTEAIIDALEFELTWKNKNCPGWHEGYQPYEDMKWALLMSETDKIYFYTLESFRKKPENMSNIGSWGHTIRPNGGEWDILGMEMYYGDKPEFVDLHGCVSSNERDLPEIEFRQFKFKYCGIDNQTPNILSYPEGQALEQLAKGDGGKARDIAARHYLFCREQIYREIPDFLKDDEHQIDHACANIFAMRGAILDEAIRRGYLYYNKDEHGRMLGAYI